jgi:hypothetical protein
MPAKLNQHRERAAELAVEYEQAARSYRTERKRRKQAAEELRHVTAAQQILQGVAQTIQQAAHNRIAAVVSECLRAVFTVPYEFKILFERKRGRTEARLVFVRDGEEFEPLPDAGGGVIDIAAFALRVACLVLSRPPLRRTLILDEPFAHCKPPEVLAPRICTLLETLADEFGIQFIIIPSIEEHFRVGRVIEI